MSEPIKAGDLAEVIDGAYRAKSPNIGKRVKVVSAQGEHSKLGRVWRCTGDNLMQFDGSRSSWADFPAIWLKKIEPDAPPPKATTTEKELTTQ
jgi:hypothetical protein